MSGGPIRSSKLAPSKNPVQKFVTNVPRASVADNVDAMPEEQSVADNVDAMPEEQSVADNVDAMPEGQSVGVGGRKRS